MADKIPIFVHWFIKLCFWW